MKSLVIVLGLLCTSYSVSGQQPQRPCELLPGGTGFVNDYSSCDAYFSCINNVAFPAKCPLPFLFNPNGPFGMAICDWPFNVVCQPCPERGVIAIPHPYFCKQYTQCINGVAIERECAPGTAFDRKKGMCVVEEEALCEEINSCGKLEGGTGNAPSTTYCNEFVVCYNGEQFGDPIKCPEGLLFDSKNNRCALKEDVKGAGSCYPGTISSSSLIEIPIRGMF